MQRLPLASQSLEFSEREALKYVNWRFAEGWHKKMWVSPSNGDPPSEWITSTVFTLPHALPNLIYGNPYDDSTD